MRADFGTTTSALRYGDDSRPLILHVVYRFATGGLENGVVNLINGLPAYWRHAVLALTEVTPFRDRVVRDDVEFIALGKQPGHAAFLYPAFTACVRRLRPSIVHTRNLAALEMAPPAWFAGVPVRVHGEHGRDVGDLDGSSRRHRLIRNLYRPFVSHYVALSDDLRRYLVSGVGIPSRQVARICNGVDLARFALRGEKLVPRDCPFQDPALWIVGAVGRMQQVKDPLTLARAFVHAVSSDPALRQRLRLIIVGDGPLQSEVRGVLEEAGVADLAWLPGERSDVASLLQAFDCFVLPSLAEGISNTLLEAMASGLPVIATNVGGNPELVVDGVTGHLVEPADAPALSARIRELSNDPQRGRVMGRAARARAENKYSLAGMLDAYDGLYRRLLGREATVGAGERAA